MTDLSWNGWIVSNEKQLLAFAALPLLMRYPTKDGQAHTKLDQNLAVCHNLIQRAHFEWGKKIILTFTRLGTGRTTTPHWPSHHTIWVHLSPAKGTESVTNTFRVAKHLRQPMCSVDPRKRDWEDSQFLLVDFLPTIWCTFSSDKPHRNSISFRFRSVSKSSLRRTPSSGLSQLVNLLGWPCTSFVVNQRNTTANHLCTFFSQSTFGQT